MTKVAIVVLADTETHEGLGRVVNALEAVKEFKDGHDDVQLIFDGAGAKWIPELEKGDHKLHGLYAAVKDRIGGVCEFCAGAFEVKDAVVACGVKLAGNSKDIQASRSSWPRATRSSRSSLVREWTDPPVEEGVASTAAWSIREQSAQRKRECIRRSLGLVVQLLERRPHGRGREEKEAAYVFHV